MQVLLLQSQLRESLARGDPHLTLHEVDVGDLLGHGVLDLDARVHLDEDDLARALARRLQQELDGTGVLVADRAGEGDRVAVECGADAVVQIRRRSDLDDLLVAPLHRAVALEQVHGLAGLVGEDLHLDVPGAHHGLLQEHPGVAEGARSLPHRLGQSRCEITRGLDATHAAAAAARHRLGEEREADVLRLGDERLDVVGCLGRTQHRHSGLDRVPLRLDLVARHLEHLRRRADEDDAVGRRLLRELRVLRQEAVSGVDRIRSRLQRDADDLVDVQVRADGVTAFADLVGLIGLESMDGPAVLMGEDRDGARPHLVRRSEGPDRDLAAVGHKDLLEHAHL